MDEERMDKFADMLSTLISMVGTNNEKLNGMSQRVDSMEKQIDGMSQRVDSMEKQVSEMSQRIGNIEQRLDKVEKEIVEIKQEQREFRAEMKTKLAEMQADQNFIWEKAACSIKIPSSNITLLINKFGM